MNSCITSSRAGCGTPRRWRRCWLWLGRAVLAGAHRARPYLAHRYFLQAEGLSCRRGDDLPRLGTRPSGASALSPTSSRSPRKRSRRQPDGGGSAGAAARRDDCRRALPPRAYGSLMILSQRIHDMGAASARRGGLGHQRTSLDRRAKVLFLQPSRRHPFQETRRSHQGALGLRTGSPETEGRTRPRPLRKAILDRSSPTPADDDDRLHLPAIPLPQAGQKGETIPLAQPPPTHCLHWHRPLSSENLPR